MFSWISKYHFNILGLSYRTAGSSDGGSEAAFLHDGRGAYWDTLPDDLDTAELSRVCGEACWQAGGRDSER